MAADREGDRHALASGDRGLIERAQIARGIEVDAGGARAAQHQAAATDIGDARLRVARIVDAGGDIGRAVEPVLQVDRQRGQVGIVAGQHDIVHRSVRGRHLDRSDRMAQAFAQDGGKAGLVGLERGGKAAPGAHHVADELGLLRPHRAEPDRVGIAVEHRRHVDEIDRIVVDDAFALLHELLDEVAQAKFFGVDLSHTMPSNRTRAA